MKSSGSAQAPVKHKIMTTGAERTEAPRAATRAKDSKEKDVEQPTTAAAVETEIQVETEAVE